MIEPTAANRPEIKEWEADSIRMTAILSPAAQLPKQSLWEELFNQPPENRTSQPRTGIQQEDGSFEGGRLTVTVQPARIDWMLTVDNSMPPSVGIPFVGKFVDVLEPFVNEMTRWLEMSPSLQRLAFGSILMLPTQEESAARQQLFAYLHHFNPQAFENAQELVYHINRPRDSTSEISNLKINRVSKWSVIRWKTLQVSSNVNSFSTIPDSFACCLELDINTSPEYQGDLPRENLQQIFLELVDFGKEIVKEGDV